MLNQLHTYCKQQFSLDTRALSIMRICLGFVLLADWIIRINSLTAHYTNSGVLPADVIYAHHWREGYFSVFLLSDSIEWCYFLFFTAIVFSFFFLIGYFTRFSTFVVWILISSGHIRNPFIIQGGDDLLRIALFWFLFLPLAKQYSVDAFYLEKKKETKVFNAASIGYILFIFSAYFFSALLKTSAEWRTEGTALYYAMSLDQMAYPLGKALLNYPTLMKYLSIGVFYLEIIAPLLFFIPINNKLFRTIGILLLMLLHVGIGFTLFVGLFYIIGISTLVGILPTEIINWKISKIPTCIKNIQFFYFLNKLLPSFISVRTFGNKLMNRISNFYTQSLLTFSLLFIMYLCILWNISTIRGSNVAVTNSFKKIIVALGLYQDWGMFAPSVLKNDGWFVLDAHSKTNKQIDIYKEGILTSYNKPHSILKYIKDDRWRKFEENYTMPEYAYIRTFYCNYLLNNWNKNHLEKIDSLSIIYMKERTLPDYQQIIPTKEILCTCKTH